MPKILHLIPYDGIGGVEVAARSMGKSTYGNINFEVAYIFQNDAHSRRWWTSLSPIAFLRAAKKIGDERPDVLIVSLWRSAIVGLLAKVLLRRLKLVVFIHSAKAVHWLDFIFTRLAIRLAYEVWGDSDASLRGRLPCSWQEQFRIISFVTGHFEALPARGVSPDFVFWGRISAEKGLERALRIFGQILGVVPNARFWIIGPDGGSLEAVQQLCKTLGVDKAVAFIDAAKQDEIPMHAQKASFYLQTSLFEGMAMSVVEAMRLGLVPVVTPVGEIASYCQQDENAVLVESDQQAIESICLLLNSNAMYQKMRTKAILTWANKPRYAESVLDACQSLLAKG